MKTQLKKNEKLVLLIKKHWLVLLNPIIWTLTLLAIASIGSESPYETFF